MLTYFGCGSDCSFFDVIKSKNKLAGVFEAAVAIAKNAKMKSAAAGAFGDSSGQG